MGTQASSAAGGEAYVSLGKDEAGDYEQVKAAILCWYDVNEESYQQCFRISMKKSSESNRKLVDQVNAKL